MSMTYEELQGMSCLPVLREWAPRLEDIYLRRIADNEDIKDENTINSIVTEYWIKRLQYKTGFIDYIELAQDDYIELYKNNERTGVFYTANGNILIDKEGTFLIETDKFLNTLYNDYNGVTSISSMGVQYKIVDLKHEGDRTKMLLAEK